jgi:MFS family permease
VFSQYRRLFDAPGSSAMVFAGLIARFPTGMAGIGSVFMVTGAGGSYGLAGALSATVLAVIALAGPQLSRLIDRHGQARIAVPAAVAASGGGLSELLCLQLHAPTWTLFLFSATAGLGPNVGALSRARWSLLLGPDEAAQHTAYAFESVVDELSFVLGPLAATLLATGLFPSAGYLVAELLLLVGTLAFCAQRRTEPPVLRRDAAAGRGSALAAPGLRVLTGVTLALGVMFGVTEITTIGFADAHGHKAAASLVLGCYAFGSMVSGLGFGLLKPKGAPARRLVLLLLTMTAILLPLPLVGSLPVLAGALFLAGMMTAPTMVTTMGLVRHAVPAAKLTEGFSWVITGLLLGVSLGAALGGWAVQHLGAGSGYGLPPAAAATALLIALLGVRVLGRSDRARATAPASAPERSPVGSVESERSEGSGKAAQVQ